MTESHYGEQIRIKKTNLTHPHAHADPRRRATSSEAPGACPGRVLHRHTQGRLGLGVLTSSLVSVTGASLVLNTKQEQAPSCSQVQPGAQGSAHKPMVLGKGSLSASFWEACFPIQQAFFLKIKFIYLFIWLHQLLVTVCRIYSLTRNWIQAPSIWKYVVLATGPPGKS